MILIVGLGNPGKKYQKTRHNLGFLILDKIKKTFKFSPWRLDQKSNSLLSFGKIEKRKIILAKPQTFVNLSGKAVKKLVFSYQILPENLWVIQDDLDLNWGKIKVSRGRGAAGHKGIESIINHLKTKDFFRIRIGIQPQAGRPKDLKRFVLQNLTKAEEKLLKKIEKKIPFLIKTARVQTLTV